MKQTQRDNEKYPEIKGKEKCYPINAPSQVLYATLCPSQKKSPSKKSPDTRAEDAGAAVDYLKSKQTHRLCQV